MSTSYIQKVLRTQSSNLVGFWPLNEERGTVAYDISGNGYNATSTGLLRSNLQRSFLAPDGDKCAQFDGSVSLINMYNSTAAAIGTPGSMSIWVATPQANLAAATKMQIFKFAVGANNFIDLTHTATAYQFNGWHEGAGTASSVNSPLKYNVDGGPFPEWHHFFMTYADGGSLTFYTDGLAETAVTSLGTFTGSMASTLMVLGSSASDTAADQFTGYLARFAWWNVILTQSEVDDLYIIGP